VEAPVGKHFGVEKILIDGRQLIGQNLIKVLDDFFIAFHALSPKGSNLRAIVTEGRLLCCTIS
jgi:hypothetical protein